MDKYAVIGNPVEHSRSPRIHQLFAAQTGQSLSYEKVLAPLDGFRGKVKSLREAGFRGANVTLPFKLEALNLSDSLSERARRAGAVNTLAFQPGGLCYGDNTDGAGLVRDLRDNHELRLGGLRILVLGAGGAVRGVLSPLLAERPARLTIANRTAERALLLAGEFGDAETVEGCGFADLDGRSFDLIVNGTSAGIAGEALPLPPDVLEPGGSCYDMLYGDDPTPFLRWAAAHGAGVMADGLGMLVEQAAESFFLWRGVRPETLPVLRELRS